jgi:hypothetical protein
MNLNFILNTVHNKKIVYLIIVIVWFLLTVPLSVYSYGSDPDSGRVAQTASKIWAEKDYFKSRTTGFPIYEILVTPFVVFGKWYLSNFVSIVFGLSIFFCLINLVKKDKKINNPFLLVIAIMFSPLVLKNSTTTMDYIPALSFIFWSYNYMKSDKYFYSAFLIGISSGFRPNYGILILSLMLYVWLNNKDLKLVGKLFLVALITGLICYSPFLMKYGIPNLDISGGVDISLKNHILIFGYNGLNFFGIVPSLFIYPILIFSLFKNKRKISNTSYYHLSNVIIHLILFSKMPYEIEYLLPILLSLICLSDILFSKKYFIISTLLILSHNLIVFDVKGGISGERVFRPSIREGAIIAELNHRIWQRSLREIVTNHYPDKKTMLFFGAQFIPVTNENWIFDEMLASWKQVDGLTYITKQNWHCDIHKSYYDDGFINLVWDHSKSEFIHCLNNEKYYLIVKDLDSYFNQKIRGKHLHFR